MASNAQYASIIKSFNGSIATTKVNDRANGTSANLVTLYTPVSALGSRTDKIRFAAAGTVTTACQILLYKGASAASAVYFDEISVQPITVTTSSPSWFADWSGPLTMANGETLFAAITVSPGIAINYVSKMNGDF